MAKTRKITATEFEYLVNLNTYVLETDTEAKKDIKYALLDTIKSVFGDSWYNLSDKTKQAIDFICFLSVERGFFYAKPETIANYAGVSKSTVYEALKVLRENGILAKANRTSRKHNGLGAAVHFFTSHPYFDHICEFLNVDWNTDRKSDRKAEMSQNACGSKDKDANSVSTYNLPASQPKENSNNMYIPYNVSSEEKNNDGFVDTSVDNNIHTAEHVTNKCKFYKYVPKLINDLFANTFGDKLVALWRKIVQAFRSIKTNALTKDDMREVGRTVLRFLVKSKNFVSMTFDEMCAYVYKGALDAFYNRLASLFLMDMEEIDGQMCYKTIDDDYVPTSSFLVNIDRNKLPEWLRYDCFTGMEW